MNKLDVKLRIIGNMLGILGYFIVLYIDSPTGSLIKFIGLSLIIPFCLRTKLYDVIVLTTFFCTLDLSNILRHWVF